ncbi:MAG: hypothetical protein NZM18_04035 [Thermoflexales bacterium]|nr:hypothetical protein [Thermoflexales bacterium]
MRPEWQLLLWVGGAFGIGLAVAAYVYRLAGRRLRAFVESETGGVIVEVARFAYFIGLPFLALISGALGADLFGLGAIAVEGAPTLAGFTAREWVRGSATAALAAGFVLIILWLAGRAGDPSVAAASTDRPTPGSALRDAAYAEAHWALYRAPFVLLTEDAYWGAIVGFALAAAEWALLQWLRRTPTRTGQTQALTIGCCALTGSLLYVTTGNLWLMIAAHAAIRWAGGRLLTRSVQAAKI